VDKPIQIKTAKWILSSYRPDGADIDDSAFAEALKLAAEDRELGEWLSSSRAWDAEFVKAIESIEIPESLREEIELVMTMDASENLHGEIDGLFSGALSSIQAPAGLRDEILAAMQLETNVSETSQPKNIAIWKWMPYAAAAVLLLTAVLIFNPRDGDGANGPGDITAGDGIEEVDDQDLNNQSTVQKVQIEAVNFLNTKFHKNGDHGFDRKAEELGDLAQAQEWLTKNDAPSTKVFPEALSKMKMMGCRKLVLKDGKEASLICFYGKDKKPVHMFVLDAKDIKNASEKDWDEKGTSLNYQYCPEMKMSYTDYRVDDAVVILLSGVKADHFESLLVSTEE